MLKRGPSEEEIPLIWLNFTMTGGNREIDTIFFCRRVATKKTCQMAEFGPKSSKVLKCVYKPEKMGSKGAIISVEC